VYSGTCIQDPGLTAHRRVLGETPRQCAELAAVAQVAITVPAGYGVAEGPPAEDRNEFHERRAGRPRRACRPCRCLS
jgi:hypothetical protein